MDIPFPSLYAREKRSSFKKALKERIAEQDKKRTYACIDLYQSVHATKAALLRSNFSTVADAAKNPTAKNHPPLSMNDFVILGILGKGRFGLVLKVRHKNSEMKRALKVQSARHIIEAKALKCMYVEKQFLMAADFKFIVQLVDTFKDSANIYMLLEYVECGNFSDFIREKRHEFTEDHVRFYAGQILLGLEYMHSADILYRDLRTSNILMAADGYIKLADFGLVKHAPHGTRSIVGNRLYRSPEMIEQHVYWKSVDWWSFGIIIYRMIFGFLPFGRVPKGLGNAWEDLETEIVSRELPFPEEHSASKYVLKLMMQLLNKNPDLRLGCGPSGAVEIKRHKWFWLINWLTLYKKEYRAPFKLTEKSDLNEFDIERDLTQSTQNLYVEDFRYF